MSFDREKYRVLVDSVAEGVIVYDERAHVQLMNDQARDLLRLTPGQIDGSERVEVAITARTIDDEEIPVDDLPVPRTLRSGLPAEIVVGVDRAGADRVWLSIRTAPLDGGGVVATVRDAADVKQARDLDRAALELATNAIDAPVDTLDEVLTDALGIMGRATGADRVVYVGIDHDEGRARVRVEWAADASPLVRREGGVPLDMMATLLGHLIRRERIVIESSAELPPGAAVPQAFFEAWSIEAATAVPLHDGRLVGFLVIGWTQPTPIPDRIFGFAVVAAGLIGSLLGRARSVGELRQLNDSLDDRVRSRSEELAREQGRIRALIDAVPDLLFEMDADGVFVNVHVPRDSTFTVDESAFLGRRVYDVVPSDMAEPVTTAIERILESGKLEVLEYVLHVDGVEHSYECRLVSRLDGGILAVVRDVTGQAEQARSLRTQSAKLARANDELEKALRAKDDFLASISHELRTPLNAILGLTEILLDQDADPLTPTQRSSLETLGASGQHLLALINDLLDLGQLEAEAGLNWQEVSAGAVGRLCLELIRPVAQPRGLQVEFVDGSDGATIWADERRLRQILLNLLDNAVKFTQPGGSVGVQVWTPEPAVVAFAVWDTGIGIDPADHDRVFEPFTQIDSTLSRRQGGSGLGLALSRRLAALHGGAIRLESRPDQGSRFVVSLPVDGRRHG